MRGILGEAMKVTRYMRRINRADGLYDVPRWEAAPSDIYPVRQSFSLLSGFWLGLPIKACHGEVWVITIEARPARQRKAKKP